MTVLTIEDEVAGFDVAMDEAPLVDLLHSDDHLNQNLNRDFQVITLLETPSGLGKVDAKQVHDDEILLTVLHIVIRVGHVLKT